MSSFTASWKLIVSGPARKSLGRLPDQDRERIEQALDRMAQDPFSGDIKRLRAPGWRRRVGSYRIFYDLFISERRIEVTDIARRTSTTY